MVTVCKTNKEIEEQLEQAWVAYCSRCKAETLIYRDHVNEAARELVNNGWRWHEHSKRLFCRLCERPTEVPGGA